MATKSKVSCKWCQEPLPDNHTGPCPKCGKTGRHITMLVISGVLSFSGGVVNLKHRRSEIVQDNRIKWASRGIGLACALGGACIPVTFPYTILLAAGFYAITDCFWPFFLQKLFKPRQ